MQEWWPLYILYMTGYLSGGDLDIVLKTFFFFLLYQPATPQKTLRDPKWGREA